MLVVSAIRERQPACRCRSTGGNLMPRLLTYRLIIDETVAISVMIYPPNFGAGKAGRHGKQVLSGCTDSEN